MLAPAGPGRSCSSGDRLADGGGPCRGGTNTHTSWGTPHARRHDRLSRSWSGRSSAHMPEAAHWAEGPALQPAQAHHHATVLNSHPSQHSLQTAPAAAARVLSTSLVSHSECTRDNDLLTGCYGSLRASKAVLSERLGECCWPVASVVLGLEGVGAGRTQRPVEPHGRHHLSCRQVDRHGRFGLK